MFIILTEVTWNVSTQSELSVVSVGPAVVNVSKSNLKAHTSKKKWQKLSIHYDIKKDMIYDFYLIDIYLLSMLETM